MDNKKVLIAGGSGFIGQKLASLLVEKGFDVSILTRNPKVNRDIFWNPEKKEIDTKQLGEIAVIVNLVGENIGVGRWTKKRKKELVDSRVDSTTFLCELAEKMPKLSYFVCASAINCYGKESDKIHIESDDFGSNFLSQLIKSWENVHVFPIPIRGLMGKVITEKLRRKRISSALFFNLKRFRCR